MQAGTGWRSCCRISQDCAFEAGAAVTLEDKVAGAGLTAAQQFVRPQNVLVDAAGKIDRATDASGRLGVTSSCRPLRIWSIINVRDRDIYG
jgi:hypothetical protein